jgi:dephospho-CoA kinase
MCFLLLKTCDMLKIGLTGGIGSGKTTVAQIFEVLAIPVYYADQAAKDLMNSNSKLKKQIISAFGSESYKDGKLDREYMSNLVFSNSEKLALLNSFVHPATINDASSWMENQKTSYAVKEAALIFEANLQDYFDYIIGVTAPESLRLERVKKRDHISEEHIYQRIQQQMDETVKMSRCDFVVVNDGIQPLLPQVLKIHNTLLSSIPKE